MTPKTIMLTTTAMKTAQSAASMRSFQTILFMSAMLLAGASTWPCARASPYLRACDRKPTAGSGESSFWKPAVRVQMHSHTAGRMVTNA